MTATAKRAAFRALHQQGCFVIPNPWDAGSARMFQHLGFSALASTSSAFAWTTGRPDYAVTLEDVLQHLKSLCDAVDLPLNADFESGFASEPEGVAANVTRAVQTGIAGLSIEDRDVKAAGLYDKSLAVARIAAARAAIDRTGHDVILVGRTEGMLADPAALNPPSTGWSRLRRQARIAFSRRVCGKNPTSRRWSAPSRPDRSMC